MANPQQLNNVQQLRHRLAMIKEDLEILKQIIKERGWEDAFDEWTNVTGGPTMTVINNIDIACDLSDDESLSWDGETAENLVSSLGLDDQILRQLFLKSSDLTANNLIEEREMLKDNVA